MIQQLDPVGGTPVSGNCFGAMRLGGKADAMARRAMDAALYARIGAPIPAAATDRSEEA